jgi:fibronectin-binding autotransporter adhesin
VGSLTSAGSNNTISIASTGFQVANTTINVTGSSIGDTLSMGTLTAVGSSYGVTLNANGANLQLTGVTGETYLQVIGSNNTTITGAVTGTGGVTQSGTGTLILTASNTYTGTTTVSGGMLQVGNGGTGESLGSGSVVLSNNATLSFYQSDTITVSNTISGNGNLIITGTYGTTNFINGQGWTYLSASNTFSGNVTVNNATLQMTSDSALGNATNTLYLNAGTLFNNNSVLTVGAGHTIVLGTNGGYIDAGWQNTGGVTVNGNITGGSVSNGLGISWDWGTVILAGSNNYLGPTLIGTTNNPYWYSGSSGYVSELIISNNAALPSSSQLIFGTNANADIPELNLNGFNASVEGLSGGTNAIITNSTTGSSTLTLSTVTGTTNLYSGTINQGSGSISLIVNGNGTQTLAASNNYSGGTFLQSGTLAISNNNAMGSGTVAFASNATIASLATLTVTNAFTIASNATATLDVATNNNLTLSGTISGTNGSLTKIDTGALTLSGTNTYTGTTTIATNGGSLSLGTTGKLASTNIVVNSGGTLLLGGNGQTTTNTALTLNGGTISTGGGTTTRAGTNSFSTLTLTANSTIDFSKLTGNTALDFNSIIASYLLTNTLTILDWSGTEASGTIIGGGTTTALIDLAGLGSLNATELSHISFYGTNGSFLGTATFDGSGVQLVPVPEPAVIIAGGLLLGWMMTSLVPKMRRKMKRRERNARISFHDLIAEDSPHSPQTT